MVNFWDRSTIDSRTKVYEEFMLPVFNDLLNLCDANELLESRIKKLTMESYNPYRHNHVYMDVRYDTGHLNRFESMGLVYIRIKLKDRSNNYSTEEILSDFISKHNIEVKWGVENKVVVNAVGNKVSVDSTIIYICVSYDIIRDFKLKKILGK